MRTIYNIIHRTKI